MKYIHLALIGLLPLLSFSQSSSDSLVITTTDSLKSVDILDQELTAFQKEINTDYADPDKSPLEKEDLEVFTGLDFFTFDSTYVVQAQFIRTEDSKPFKMKTTTSRKPVYTKYGEAHFVINDTSYSLNIYQSKSLMANEEFKDYLFLPFTDLTNGDESYGGGRFIDLKIPASDSFEIDFNKAYNPYCAYNHQYSCPIPPAENHLEVKIRAGVMNPH